MTNYERRHQTLNFELVDKLPIMEWAAWWDETLERWRWKGLPEKVSKGGCNRVPFRVG